MNDQKKLFGLIAFSTALRMLIASSLELTNAEVYYWSYALHLQWNYFDHPPIVAWMIRLTTANLLLHDAFFVRLGAMISAAVCTVLIFKIGTVIYNRRAGWLAALLYTASTYASIGAGAFILPDSPQMIFWLSAVLILISLPESTVNDADSRWYWILFGILSGLCIMSKVHGVFLWFGVILYAFRFNRNWLKSPGIYLAAIICFIIISPILIWNLQHYFVTYTFHSNRVSLAGAVIKPMGFVKELFAMILVANPVNFLLICSSLFWFLKGAIPVDKKPIQLILCCSLPLILIFLFISLFRDTLPHWPGPAFSSLLLLPAIQLASSRENKTDAIPNTIKLALGIMFILGIGQVIITNYYPGTTSRQKDGLTLGTGDYSLDMYGWKEAGKQFDSLYSSDTTKKIMLPGSPILATKWYPAAHLDFYFADKTNQQVLGIGNISDLHQYYWMNQYKKPLKKGDNAYYIVPSNLFDYKKFDEVMNQFDSYELALIISQYRGGTLCKQISIFRVRGYHTGN